MMTALEVERALLGINRDIENIEEEMYDNPVENTLRVYYNDENNEWKIIEDEEVTSILELRENVVIMHSFKKGNFARVIIPYDDIYSISLDTEETDDGFSRVILNVDTITSVVPLN